ncbi:EndoU domain-containing protein [Saccharopolyspora sp. 6M]|uniref:EndoU domain-containing protein n=1 Tax=Saccharopolyspora sp. 6M TaxID=2877237 RepID=UPI001CD4CFF2|nr:EndoU domain-containing protein [Saccharopolyspora sp. 6M]MCA1227316.1 EndoU domain-containing protein [Saccharopolyspora sp. 6M]
MDRFAVRYASLGEARHSVEGTGADIEEQLARLDAYLGPLRAGWSGVAADEMALNLAALARLLAEIDENYRHAHGANLGIWGGPAASGGSAGPAGTAPMSAGGSAGADEVDVSVEELRRVARSFYGLQQRLADNMAWISRNLAESAAGMAGADPVLASWRSLYDHAVRMLWGTLRAATNVLGGIAQGMTDTGNNYVDSELASTAGHGSRVPNRLPALGVDEVRPSAPPPSCAAAAPAQPRPDWAFDYWPDGYPERLRFAAGEWEHLVGVLHEISAEGDALIDGLVRDNRGEVFDRIRGYWETKSQLCGTAQIFPAVTATTTLLAQSCRELAKGVQRAQQGMRTLAEQREADRFLDVLATALGYLPGPWAKAASAAVDVGEYFAVLAIVERIKSNYDADREVAVARLADSGAAARLREWAGSDTEIGSESRVYSQVDAGLEQRLGDAPYDGWAAVDEPHPDPASVHITAAREAHVLGGDRTGGGHLAGTGAPGKTEFPAEWDRELILNNARSVGRNPDQPPVHEPDGRWLVNGVRDGVRIVVILDPDGSVVTTFPQGGPGVIENPRRKR